VNLKIHHPWWTHLPALACVATSGVLLATADAPTRVPVHFGFDGQADRFGSIIELWIAFVGIPLLFVLGWFFVDEGFARYEDKRRFNWLALFDEAFAGFFLGMTIQTIPLLSASKPVLQGVVWTSGLMCAGVAVLAAAVLELLRPYRPMERAPLGHTPPAAPIAADIADQSKRWVHWEVQNPLYLRLIIPAAVALLTFGAVVSFPAAPWILPAFLIGIAILAACYGGMRVSVNRDRLLVRLGVIGIPLLKVRTGDIEKAEAIEFSPLGDFGGWGIRYSLSKRMWGFYFYGTRGTLITKSNGKRYLIGSDTPETLAGICETARQTGKSA
jgi:hypothetical protein